MAGSNTGGSGSGEGTRIGGTAGRGTAGSVAVSGREGTPALAAVGFAADFDFRENPAAPEIEFLGFALGSAAAVAEAGVASEAACDCREE
jgi:hypothetical protein